MISHLLGTLEHIDQIHVVIDVNNIGYQVKRPGFRPCRPAQPGEKS